MIMVASYCRVSTDKEDQVNSFDAQQRYFRQYIERQPDWELYRVYADEGISGTSTKKRVQFNHMVSDARMGKFQLILTKEVSRFSRNILDTIAYTRELKSLGVGVLFMNDGINTLEPDAELRLSIMGSIAQEESRKTSARVKWGQTRQMERGVVFGRSMLGYDVSGGKMTVNAEGAALVRQIFYKYGVEQKGSSTIARELREAGYLTFRGNPHWSSNQIIKILKNEKYVGDLVQKKTYTPDYLTHQKKYNHGAEKKVCLTNHHEAIIDRDLWNTVQAELTRRNRHGQFGVGHGNRYVFSGKIKCGLCGSSFVARKKQTNTDAARKRWCCSSATTEGRRHRDPMGNLVGCDIGTLLRDDFAHEVLDLAAGAVLADPKWTTEAVAACTKETIHHSERMGGESTEQLDYQIQQIKEKKESILEAFFAKDITKEEMRWMSERYDHQLANLQDALRAAREREQLSYDTAALKNDVNVHVRDLAGKKRDELFQKNILNTVTVYPGHRLEVRLNLLPAKWRTVLDAMADLCSRCQIAPSMPMSVSRPWIWG